LDLDGIPGYLKAPLEKGKISGQVLLTFAKYLYYILDFTIGPFLEWVQREPDYQGAFMNEKKRLYFKRLLMERINALLEGAEKTVSGMSNDYKEELLDPTDRASLESNRNFTLRIRDRERRLIQKLNEALERIEDGTFGICEMCERKISEKRLMARPVTTLCIECKTEQEQREKMRGE
jgi:DnaK suppressor protein